MELIIGLINMLLIMAFAFSVLNVTREFILFILSFFRNDEDEFKDGGKYKIPKQRLILFGITLSYFITILFNGLL